MFLIDMADVVISKELKSEPHDEIRANGSRFVEIENHAIDHDLIIKVGLGDTKSIEMEEIKLIYYPNWE